MDIKVDINMASDDPRSEQYSFLNVARNIVLIINLKKSLDDKELQNTLETYGELQWCHVAKGPNGSYGFAFAKFFNEESAKHVIKNVPPLPAEKENQSVRIFMSNIRSGTRFCDNGKFYITGVAETVTEQDIKEIVQGIGSYFAVKRIDSCSFVVHMLTEWHMECFLEKLKAKKMDTKDFQVHHFDNIFESGGGTDGRTRVVVRIFNLDPKIRSQDLCVMFRFLGHINARALKDAYGRSRRTGYVYLNKPYADTPFFSLFKEVKYENGEIRLTQKAGNLINLQMFEMRQFKDTIRTMYYPSAQPPIQEKYYRVPKEFRRDIRARDFFENKEDASETSKILTSYNVHVTNIESYRRRSLQKVFEYYGHVVHTLIVPQSEPYAIVTFRNLSDAHRAVQGIASERANKKTALVAGLMDCFQLHYWNEHRSRVLKLSSYSNLESLRSAEFPMYDDYIHQITDEGHVKRFSKSNYAAVTKFVYSALSDDLNRDFEELYEADDVADQPSGSDISSEPQQSTSSSSQNDSKKDAQESEKTQKIVVSEEDKTEAINLLNDEQTSQRLRSFFAKRTEEDIAALVDVLREMPHEEITKLNSNDDSLRLFCLTHLISKARIEAKKN
ncbi:unnamed protein product [Caenorhabditis brenneri]